MWGKLRGRGKQDGRQGPSLYVRLMRASSKALCSRRISCCLPPRCAPEEALASGHRMRPCPTAPGPQPFAQPHFIVHCTASPASHCSAPRHLAHQIHGNVTTQKRPHPNTVGTKVGRPSRNTLPSPRLAASLRTISRSNRVENAVSERATFWYSQLAFPASVSFPRAPQ